MPIDLREVPESWLRGDPASLVPEWEARLSAIEAIDPEVATASALYGAVIAGAGDAVGLTERHTVALGRERGALTKELAALPGLPIERRRTRGKALNLAKALLEDAAKARRAALEGEAERRSAAGLDVTLPGRRPWVGRRHVLAQVQDELLDLFHGLGYSVYTSPEVEKDEYNFTKLNFAPDHPARDAHDTYFVREPEILLRTHTSPGWVRAMEQRKPPLRLVFPGRVYRAEQIDASHMDQFHQMDGLFVGENVSLADLKSTLATFARAIYGSHVRVRFIPIYFPFVEPGAQLDVSCVICDGTGERRDGGGGRCPVCKGSGWLEVLGSGMVHPNVFRAVGYDPEKWTGFAFGMGLERIAMLRHGVPEIRLFLENDLRFLESFPT